MRRLVVILSRRAPSTSMEGAVRVSKSGKPSPASMENRHEHGRVNVKQCYYSNYTIVC